MVSGDRAVLLCAVNFTIFIFSKQIRIENKNPNINPKNPNIKCEGEGVIVQFGEVVSSNLDLTSVQLKLGW